MPSIRAQVAALAVGECYSQSERLDFDSLTRNDLSVVAAAIRNALAPSVRRAADETGNEYTIEMGEWRTRSRDMVLTFIVTRTT